MSDFFSNLIRRKLEFQTKGELYRAILLGSLDEEVFLSQEGKKAVH